MISFITWLGSLTKAAKLGIGLAVIGGSSVVAVPAVRGCTDQPVTFTSTENEVIRANEKYIKDGSLQLEETVIKTPGLDGSKEVKYEITKKCEKEISKNILEQKEINSPRTAVIRLGTKYNEDKEVSVPFQTITKYDSTLDRGRQITTVEGVNGLNLETYEIYQHEGEDKVRKKVSTKVITKPTNKVIAIGTKIKQNCDPNYSPCVPNVSYDLDCADIGFSVSVIGSDPHRFDADYDGYGCESY